MTTEAQARQTIKNCAQNLLHFISAIGEQLRLNNLKGKTMGIFPIYHGKNGLEYMKERGSDEMKSAIQNLTNLLESQESIPTQNVKLNQIADIILKQYPSDKSLHRAIEEQLSIAKQAVESCDYDDKSEEASHYEPSGESDDEKMHDDLNTTKSGRFVKPHNVSAYEKNLTKHGFGPAREFTI